MTLSTHPMRPLQEQELDSSTANRTQSSSNPKCCHAVPVNEIKMVPKSSGMLLYYCHVKRTGHENFLSNIKDQIHCYSTPLPE